MDIQLIISIFVGMGASLYLIKELKNYFYKSDMGIKCKECSIEKKNEENDK